MVAFRSKGDQFLNAGISIKIHTASILETIPVRRSFPVYQLYLEITGN